MNYILISIIIFIFIPIFFIIKYLLDQKNKKQYYKCDNGKCVPCSDCKDYTTSDCDNKCNVPPPPPPAQQYYKCDNGKCVPCSDCKDY